MNVIEIIEKKRDGIALSAAEIAFFVQGITEGSIADYQASAWLMAVFLRGMTEEETLALTLAMRDSGQKIDLSDLALGPTLDKHSTGGVGDKTTLVVVPILAAGGVPMLKMSGRALGFSGGTIDKLESIPGFRVDLGLSEAKAQVKRIGAALIAQSQELCPADKILYALRDATATIASLPLIASSILSKKLAAGAARIVLDVKVGHGAFMKTRAEAEALARVMIALGTGAGVPTTAELTAMDEPLGFMVGNALEVREAITALTEPSRAEKRFRELCLELAARGFALMEQDSRLSLDAARQRATHLLHSGKAAAKFAEIIAAQGGPEGMEAILAALPVAPVQHIVTTKSGGRVIEIEAETIGRLAMQFGAGRARKSEAIDPAVGIEMHVKTGDLVAAGDALATLHLRATDSEHAPEFAKALRAVCTVRPASEPFSPRESLLLASLP